MKLLHSISSGALGNFSTYASNSDSSSTKCWLSLAPFTLHVAPLLAHTASQLSPRLSPQVQPSLRGAAGGGGKGGGEGGGEGGGGQWTEYDVRAVDPAAGACVSTDAYR